MFVNWFAIFEYQPTRYLSLTVLILHSQAAGVDHFSLKGDGSMLNGREVLEFIHVASSLRPMPFRFLPGTPPGTQKASLALQPATLAVA